MVSPAKLAANRRNAQKSTGPRTPQGKAAVRLNALKHGLTARQPLVSPQEITEFHNLLRELQADLHPVGPLENCLVLEIVTAAWHILRLQRIEMGFLSSTTADDLRLVPALVRIARHAARRERSFYKALHALKSQRKGKSDKTKPRPPGPRAGPGLPAHHRKPRDQPKTPLVPRGNL